MTVWPSGLRRWLKAPVRKGVGSNPTAVNCAMVCTAQTAYGHIMMPLYERVNIMTAVGFEPTPLRTGAWSQRLRPLGQTVLIATACI